MALGMVTKAGEHAGELAAAEKLARRQIRKMLKAQEVRGYDPSAEGINSKLWVSGAAHRKPGEKALGMDHSDPLNVLGPAEIYASDSNHVMNSFAGHLPQQENSASIRGKFAKKGKGKGNTYVVRSKVERPLNMDAPPFAAHEKASASFASVLNDVLKKHGIARRVTMHHGKKLDQYHSFQDIIDMHLPPDEAAALIRVTSRHLHDSGYTDAMVSRYRERALPHDFSKRKPLRKDAGKKDVTQVAFLDPRVSGDAIPLFGPSKSDLHKLFAYLNSLKKGR